MPPVLVQAVAQGNSGPATGGQDITLAGTVAGNVMVCVGGLRAADASLIVFPVGWTILGSFSGAQTSRSIKTAGIVSPGGAVTVHFPSGSPPNSAVLAEYSGITVVGPGVETDTDYANSTTPSFPAIVAPVAGGVLWSIQWKQPATPNPGPITIAGPQTLVADTLFAGAGNRHRLTVWQQIVATAGAFPAYTTSGSTDGSEDGIMSSLFFPADAPPSGGAFLPGSRIWQYGG